MSNRNPANLLEAAPVTCLNLVVCICYYIYLGIVSGKMAALHGGSGGMMDIDIVTLTRHGASMPEGLWAGEWQRLVLPMFMHGDILHVCMNMFWLWYLGVQTEMHFGSSNFGTIYFLSGIGGFCLSMMLGGNVSVGASGCIFGMMGAHLAVEIAACASISRAWKSREVRRMAFMVGFFYVLGLLTQRTDHWAHLGGLVLGTLYGLLFEVWRKRQRIGVALLGLLLAFTVGLIVLARWTVVTPHYHVFLALKAEDEGRRHEADERFSAAREAARFMRSGAAGGLLLDRAGVAYRSNDALAMARWLELAAAVGSREQAALARAGLAGLATLDEPGKLSQPGAP